MLYAEMDRDHTIAVRDDVQQCGSITDTEIWADALANVVLSIHRTSDGRTIDLGRGHDKYPLVSGSTLTATG